MSIVAARFWRRREPAVQVPAPCSCGAERVHGSQAGVVGRTVAVVGELSEWSSQDGVRAAIGAAGGRYLGVISHQVDVVVLGSLADDDDAATAMIRRARKMVDAGRDIQIIDEAEFIALIGLPSGGPGDSFRRRPGWAGQWRGWGPPSAGVVDTDRYVREFVSLLGPRRAGGYVEPREVALFRDEGALHGVDIVVECRGLVIGRLDPAAAAGVSEAMDADFLDRVRVPAVLCGGAIGDTEGFGVGLWPERAVASDEMAAALATLGPRIDPWPPDWR